MPGFFWVCSIGANGPDPWFWGREEETKLAVGDLVFRHQRPDAHFFPYTHGRLHGHLDPFLYNRSRSWRAQAQRLRVCSQDRKSRVSPAERSQEGTEGLSIPICPVCSESSEWDLLLLSSCQCPSRPFKAATDQERDEQTGWVQEEVGGWRGDSCISG